MVRIGRFGGLAAAALLAISGCGESPPPASSSIDQVKVKGAVTHKGKPVPKVEVRFNPANVNHRSAASVTATAGDDGKYELNTLVGENTVSLTGAPTAKNAALAAFTRSVDLKAGDNTVDIDVP